LTCGSRCECCRLSKRGFQAGEVVPDDTRQRRRMSVQSCSVRPPFSRLSGSPAFILSESRYARKHTLARLSQPHASALRSEISPNGRTRLLWKEQAEKAGGRLPSATAEGNSAPACRLLWIGNAPVSLRNSENAQDHQKDQNQQQPTKSTAGIISPASAVGPRGQAPQQEQDQENQ
jgi:hypothetical protein